MLRPERYLPAYHSRPQRTTSLVDTNSPVWTESKSRIAHAETNPGFVLKMEQARKRKELFNLRPEFWCSLSEH